MFLQFFYLLRARGLEVSINEWMTLVEALDKGLANSSLMGFYQLCRSILIKTESEYDKFDQIFAEYFEGIETPEDLPEQAQDAAYPDGEVSRAIMSLPEKERLVVLLRYYEGLSLKETAEAAGMSLATAKRQISKANQLLHQRLEGWYYDE